MSQHLEAMQAEFAALEALHKGVKRKNQPGYHRVKRPIKGGKMRWQWVSEAALQPHEREALGLAVARPEPPPAMSRAALAEALRTTEKNLDARLVGLRVSSTCDRCGGSGHYSFNQIHGTTCYGCKGTGQQAPTAQDWPQVVQDALTTVRDGRLDAYEQRLAARQRVKAGSRQLFKAWEALSNAHGYHYPMPSPPEVRRWNDVAYSAVNRFEATQRVRDVDWVEADRVLSEGLAAIAAATAEAEAAVKSGALQPGKPRT